MCIRDRAVEDAGGVPVLLPVVSDLENVKIQMESLDEMCIRDRHIAI